ncbi:dachshund homolog 1-like isoform X2 [Uloborus diversus]|uniref:dachshund homolog 1-like isoform X2 n=1 Tax=Uloborus diversus TaxID=327109 RepID=UPI002409E46A|nr:dachshund homolog 1-like isoform X2 [Uloborus diversus]
MEGSSGEGSTSPSADRNSPPSLQHSPNPDSSGMGVGDCGALSYATQPPMVSLSPKHQQPPVSSNNGIVVSSPGYVGQQPRTSSASPPQILSKPYTPPMSSAALSMKSPLEHLPAHMGMLAMRNGGVPHPHYLGGPPGRGAHIQPPLSPPGLTTDATANDCRLIDYRGAKVAAFLVNGDYLLCLPQAFELFLKHLVGGLHTVYTKLKRLDITPIVCNVEQVRILRGLGAIQPGVNRCKLLSCKDFDTLYKDCTTARPGRPPKRATMVGMNPNGTSHGMLLKKSRMDGEYTGYENGHITDQGLYLDSKRYRSEGDRVDKSHLLANGYSHHVAAVAAAATPHLNPLPFMALNHAAAAAAHHNSMLSAGAAAGMPLAASTPGQQGQLPSQQQHLNSSSSSNRGGPAESSSVIKERATSHASEVINSTRLRDERGDLVDSKERLYGFDSHRMKDQAFLNGYFWLLAGASANGHSPVLNLSQHSSRPSNQNQNPTTNEHSGSENAYNDGPDDDDNDSEDDDDDDEREHDLSDNPDVSSTANTDRLPSSQQQMGVYPTMGGESGPMQGQTASSMETLLRNIQGLLKVAADNARQQERQINLEKAELKMELLREREVREGIEKQLLDEQRTRILYQKRLKKEKRTRRRVQEQLEAEVKKRAQYEEALRSNSAETLRLLNESLAQELERERNARAEAEHKMQDCPMSV